MDSHKDPQLQRLNKGQTASVLYHDIFDFPLTKKDLFRWEMGEALGGSRKTSKVMYKNGFFFLEGRDYILKKRLARKTCSQEKLLSAKKAATWLARIPTILFVGVTGSLAMENASLESDIDLMIITKKNTLWSTRAAVYFLFALLRIPVRRPLDPNERDKLCLNIWMSKDDLLIKQKNIYTAHELAQIVPLVNKEGTFEELIEQNLWICKFWPKAVNKKKPKDTKRKAKHKPSAFENVFFKLLDYACYTLQFHHMKDKVSREVVTQRRAFFHPFDWGQKVADELLHRGVKFKKYNFDAK